MVVGRVVVGFGGGEVVGVFDKAGLSGCGRVAGGAGELVVVVERGEGRGCPLAVLITGAGVVERGVFRGDLKGLKSAEVLRRLAAGVGEDIWVRKAS